MVKRNKAFLCFNLMVSFSLIMVFPAGYAVEIF